MRTTLTIDDDLAKALHEESRRTGRPFKEVVNEAVRRGLMAGAAPAKRPRRFRVHARPCGFRPGIDIKRLNQLVDELEIDHAAVVARRDR